MNLLMRSISTIPSQRTVSDGQRLRFSSVARLLLLLLLLMLSGVAHAQSTTGTTGDGLKYTTANNQVTITGYSGTGGAVSIPDKIDGLPVTSIGAYTFNSCSGLTSITIGNGVINIGEAAFSSCSSLTSMTIPGSVTSIGANAFSRCRGLTSLTIPCGVTSIGEAAFYSCSSLTSVTIPGSVITIGNSAFGSCSSLRNVTIGNGVTNIGNGAFSWCGGLTSVTIPGSVTSIGANAFDSCPCLNSATIGNGVISIGRYAFSGCSSLTSMTIPGSVTSIGAYAFNSCSGLTSVTIGKGVTNIGEAAFYSCSSLTNVTIPGSVILIGRLAFGNTSLKTAVFNGNAPSMGSFVFTDAPSDFTVNYYVGTTGFTSPTWYGYPAVNIGYSPVASWLVAKGLDPNVDLQSAPHGDGVPLLMAYALNLDPTRNQSGSIPRPVVGADQMSLTFYAGSDGVAYSVESSTDLTTWSTQDVSVSAPDANKFRTATVHLTDSRRFMRLKVVR